MALIGLAAVAAACAGLAAWRLRGPGRGSRSEGTTWGPHPKRVSNNNPVGLTHPGRFAGSGLSRRVLPALALALVATLALAGHAEAKPVFGIVPQDGALPTAADLDMMPTGGIGGMRTMLPWASVEQSPGNYEWGGFDAIIRETTSRGIAPLVFIYGTPDWAARMDGRNCDAGACSVYPPRTPATRAAFQAFAAAAAKRYGPGGDFWSVPVEYVAAARYHRRAFAHQPRGHRQRALRPTADLPADTAPAPAADRSAAAGPAPMRVHKAEPDHRLADLERAELSQVLCPDGRRPRLRGDAEERRRGHPLGRSKRRDHARWDVGPELGAQGGDADQGLPAEALQTRCRRLLRFDRDPPLRRRRQRLDGPARDGCARC